MANVRSAAAPVDPRVAKSRQVVLSTAADLLVEGGPSAVTIDAIVARSKVAKSTIYRHWATRDEVLVAMLAECVGPTLGEPSPTAPPADALRSMLYSLVDMLSDPAAARAVATMILLKLELKGLNQLEQSMERTQLDTLRSVLDRGVREGLIKADYDGLLASAQLLGPLMFAHLTGALPCDRALADHTLEVFLNTYGTSPN